MVLKLFSSRLCLRWSFEPPQAKSKFRISVASRNKCFSKKSFISEVEELVKKYNKAEKNKTKQRGLRG